MPPGRLQSPSAISGPGKIYVLEPEALGQRKDELAVALREARKQVGLTGDRLAARCGMSQSKISKIETGKVLPSATDVERILSCLGVGKEQAADLMALARLANTEFHSVRASLRRGLHHKQRELAALEADQPAHPVLLAAHDHRAAADAGIRSGEPGELPRRSPTGDNQAP